MKRLRNAGIVPASMFVRSLVSGLPTDLRERRVMFFLQGAFDDSGSEPTSPFFVLAGFLANVGQWERFADAWQAKLRADPAIGYFKMSEAMGRYGEFDGWPRALRDQKVLELAEIIVPSVIARV